MRGSLCSAPWADNKACALCGTRAGTTLNPSFSESQAAVFWNEQSSLCSILELVSQRGERAAACAVVGRRGGRRALAHFEAGEVSLAATLLIALVSL